MLIDEIKKEYKNRNSYSEFEKEIQCTYELIIYNIKTYARIGIDHFIWRVSFIEDKIVEKVCKKLIDDHFTLCWTEFGITISGWVD